MSDKKDCCCDENEAPNRESGGSATPNDGQSSQMVLMGSDGELPGGKLSLKPMKVSSNGRQR